MHGLLFLDMLILYRVTAGCSLSLQWLRVRVHSEQVLRLLEGKLEVFTGPQCSCFYSKRHRNVLTGTKSICYLKSGIQTEKYETQAQATQLIAVTLQIVVLYQM